VDLLEIKGHIAVALVESIFRRAGFAIEPAEGELPVRHGREDLAPDFRARRPAPGERPAAGRLVEVRYRPQVEQYLAIEVQRGLHSVFSVAKRQWPDLVFVFVTDHPEPGRSCFQLLDLGGWGGGGPLSARDLHADEEFRVYRQNVEEHEALLRRMFALLTGS
jgi:hypothetical protein